MPPLTTPSNRPDLSNPPEPDAAFTPEQAKNICSLCQHPYGEVNPDCSTCVARPAFVVNERKQYEAMTAYGNWMWNRTDDHEDATVDRERRAAWSAGAEWQAQRQSAPVDMLLFCPQCGEQHIDEAAPDVCELCGDSFPPHLEDSHPCEQYQPWLNPPHKSHRCGSCNHVWRPADIPTNGVAQIKTVGANDGNARPRYYYTAKDFEDAALAAQSAQRDALAGLLERWDMMAGGPVGQSEGELAYDDCAAELRAILEGKP